MEFNKITITPGQELVVIDKSLEHFKGAGQVLVNNTTIAERAETVGRNILAMVQDNAARYRAITGEGEELDRQRQQLREERATLDARANAYLLQVSTRFKECNAARTPLTQIMDEIRRLFTLAEARLDVRDKNSVPYRLQAERNQYARELKEEEERKRLEAERKLRLANEEIALRAAIRRTIGERLVVFLAQRKRAVLDHFNLITLADFPEKSSRLKNMATAFNPNHLDALTTFPLPLAVYHAPLQVSTIKDEEVKAYDFQEYYRTYERDLAELKRDLVDKLSAKWQELEEIELAKKSDVVAAENLVAEQRRREENDHKKILDDQAQKSEAIALQEETRKEGDQLVASFTHQAEIHTPAPKTQVKLRIRVKSIAGWMELFKFWAEREKGHLQALADSGIEAIEELEKKEFKSLRSYAERLANDKKNPIRIASPYLIYEEDIKAKTTK